MNNTELIYLFQTISKAENCFDETIALKKITKEYKKSGFYKETHIPINKAYLIFKLRGLNNIANLLGNPIFTNICNGNIDLLRVELEDFIASFDFTKLDGLFNYLTDQLNKVNILDLQSDLTNTLQEFKKSFKL